MRLSGTVLSELGARWSHVQGVGAAADHLVSELNLGDDAEAVRSAAWLHDVGYAPALVQSVSIRSTGHGSSARSKHPSWWCR